MKKIFLFFIFIQTFAEARLINKCGTYYAEGYYTEISSSLHNGKKKPVILLERGSNSEIKFYILNSNMSQVIPKNYVGVNFQLKLKFISSCWYHCEGEIIEVIAPLDPFQPPKPFLYPRPVPLPNTEIACHPNTFEDTE